MTYHAYPGAVLVIDLTVSDSEASEGGSDVDATVIRHGQMDEQQSNNRWGLCVCFAMILIIGIFSKVTKGSDTSSGNFV